MIKNKREREDGVSRRDLLAGAAAVAVAVASPVVLAAPVAKRAKGQEASPTGTPLRRYMAASAVLGDGRILVTGGYDRPLAENATPSPLNSAMILDPRTGKWSNAAPMRSHRARHAAVALLDGRIAVLGGLGMNPTASVEIYDPRTNTWEAGIPLAQPRYDHSAVIDGTNIYVLGGSSNSMLSSTEIYQTQTTRTTNRGGCN